MTGKKATIQIVVQNSLGLHSAPAGRIAQHACRSGHIVTIATKDEEVNAASIMGIMMLAAGPGTEVTISAIGLSPDIVVTEILEVIRTQFFSIDCDRHLYYLTREGSGLRPERSLAEDFLKGSGGTDLINWVITHRQTSSIQEIIAEVTSYAHSHLLSAYYKHANEGKPVAESFDFDAEDFAAKMSAFIESRLESLKSTRVAN